MARDRDKAKARRAERRAAQGNGDVPNDVNPGPEPTEPHREAVPGSLDHASGEVDEAQAAIVAGAGGRDDDVVDDAELEQAAVAAGSAAGGGDAGSGSSIAATTPGQPSKGGIVRFGAFLRASWAELQRVQWPDRRQVGQGTAVTLGFVVIAGLYLGVADKAAQEVVDLIL